MGYIIDTESILLLGIIIILAKFIITILLNRKNLQEKVKRELIFKKIFIHSVLIIYISFVCSITIFPILLGFKTDIPFNGLINLNPLSIFSNGFNFIVLVNVIGNFLLFFPLPILLWLNGNFKFCKLKPTIIIVFICSLSIEIIQYIENFFQINAASRVSDITDLILNVGGAILGYFVLKIYLKYTNKY